MNKTTINTILIAIITLMSISICFLIFCITTRPRYVTVNEPESAVITEAAIIEETQLSSDSDATIISTEETADTLSYDIMRGKTSTKVNMRDAASSDARVLYTVEEGTTFDILEIQDNGWTKIFYDETEAYISSDFVIIIRE